MNRRALAPAAATVVLHLAALAGVVMLADAPVAPRPAEPLRVTLLTPPPAAPSEPAAAAPTVGSLPARS
ncbi:MAG: hypothetical protein ACLGHB_07000, partial [Gammaproteobacteria bacterium]